MMQLENSTVRRDVRPWEWERYEYGPDDEYEEDEEDEFDEF